MEPSHWRFGLYQNANPSRSRSAVHKEPITATQRSFLFFSLHRRQGILYSNPSEKQTAWVYNKASFFFLKFYLFWERESGGGAERESQAGSVRSAHSPTRGSVSQAVRSCPEPKSRARRSNASAAQAPQGIVFLKIGQQLYRRVYTSTYK